MEAPLAIYEALVHANAPVEAARNAAEKLERDMTHALTIRQDLQRLEANFQRLETRVESGFALVDERFASTREEMGARFTLVDHRLETIQKEMDSQFAAMGQMMDSRFAAMRQETDSRLSLFDERFGSFENRLLIKLGALMVVLFTTGIGVLALAG